MVQNIKQLQEKIRTLNADDSLSTTEQQSQQAELQRQLDEQLVSIQLSVKQNVSSLIGNLFASPSNASSGLFFNQNA